MSTNAKPMKTGVPLNADCRSKVPGLWAMALDNDDANLARSMATHGLLPLPPSGACLYSALSKNAKSVAKVLFEIESEVEGLSSILKRGPNSGGGSDSMVVAGCSAWGLEILLKADPTRVLKSREIMARWVFSLDKENCMDEGTSVFRSGAREVLMMAAAVGEEVLRKWVATHSVDPRRDLLLLDSALAQGAKEELDKSLLAAKGGGGGMSL